MSKLLEILQAKQTLVLDGAMGTELFARGLESGDPPEEWNVSHPERIVDVHAAYFAAGSDVILTNSFGGTAYRLKLHKLQDRVYEFNFAAAANGRKAAEQVERDVLVAGSIGPTGELLEPMGSMTFDDAVAAFAEQARGLSDGGADILWIETMSDLDEVRAAVEGCRQVSDLPVCATMSFDTKARTMMGVDAESAVKTLASLGLAALGANCGNDLDDTERVMLRMRAQDANVVLIVKANAGIPQWHGEDLIYDGTPDVMGAYAHRMREAGVQLIGGCCGSAPAHVQRMRQVLDGVIPVPVVERAAQAVEAPGPLPKKSREPRRRRRRR